MRLFVVALVYCSTCSILCAEPNPNLDPQIQTLVKGVSLTLVAEHPDVMTPTGIDCDRAGNLWYVCCHTHFRPEGYDGPEHDEVVVLRDGQRRVFYNKTDATMDLELSPNFDENGWVYLAERDRILRVRDTDRDGKGDVEENVAVLKTEGDYPHNGLSGMAWHPSGDLIFALGENYWKEWTLSSQDGSTVAGTGEGGIFRCKPDGSQLRRIAKGFWNPFGICARSDGTMFACENDPGARPPCRLLHIVEGGDYGYQRLYGNAPHHPFVCWDGELPGTLPMLFSVGEAPCGIAPMANGLVVTSWADNRIDFYPLSATGASYETNRVSLISGSLDFRPTCIVKQSPTVYYLTDWVVGSYQLHRKGRIWKLEIDTTANTDLKDEGLVPPTSEAILATRLRQGGDGIETKRLMEIARSKDAFLSRAAIDALSSRIDQFKSTDLESHAIRDQINLMLAIRKSDPKNASWVRRFMASDNAEVQVEVLRWIADEKLTDFLPDVKEQLGATQTDYQRFVAALAAHNTLSGNPRAGIRDNEILIERIVDVNASALSRAYSLRLVDPKHKKLRSLFGELIKGPSHPVFEREYVRTISQANADLDVMMQFLSPNTDSHVQVCAAAGIQPSSGQHRQALLEIALDSNVNAVREEALRSLRSANLSNDQREQLMQLKKRSPESADLIDAALNPESIKTGRPPATDITAWSKRLAAVAQPIDVLAGERIFHHHSVGACSKCHRHNGRGQTVGPDLSITANGSDPNRILTALLQPSRDVDPQYFPRSLIFEDGKSFTGILLRNGGSGKEFYRDNTGRERLIKTADIVARKELRTSLMPDGLIDTMTDREIRDLLAFLDYPISHKVIASADKTKE